jgi:thiamine biosynthesis protein ThiS
MNDGKAKVSVKLNGEVQCFEAGTTLQQLVEKHGLKVNSILIELNGAAVPRREWPTRAIAENDQMEFLRVVAGG